MVVLYHILDKWANERSVNYIFDPTNELNWYAVVILRFILVPVFDDCLI